MASALRVLCLTVAPPAFTLSGSRRRLIPRPSSWIRCRKQFFLPGPVLSKMFRGKFLAHLATVRRQLFLYIDDNYFSRSTTTTKLLVGQGRSPAAGRFCFRSIGRARRRSCGNVGIAPLLARFPRGDGKGGKPGVGFPGFPRHRHFHSSLCALVLVVCSAAHPISPWLSACWFFFACSTR